MMLSALQNLGPAIQVIASMGPAISAIAGMGPMLQHLAETQRSGTAGGSSPQNPATVQQVTVVEDPSLALHSTVKDLVKKTIAFQRNKLRASNKAQAVNATLERVLKEISDDPAVPVPCMRRHQPVIWGGRIGV
eukprot:COSAG01_NODE_4809_length_4726_cov_9.458612_1_plen_134_part_00